MRFRLPPTFRNSKTVRLHSFAFAVLAMAGLVITAFLQKYTVDLFFEDTYFVVTAGHLVMAAATLFGVFAVAWTIFQAWSRRRLHERLGQAHFWLTLAGVIMSLGTVWLFTARPHLAGEPAVGQAYVAMFALLFTVGVQLAFPLALILSWIRREAA
jgi:heme/copper-type cytochrome/quinol oxidase subunit 1